METVSSSQTVIINSSESQQVSRQFSASGKTSLTVVIEGDRKLDLSLEITAQQGSSLTFMLINHNEAEVSLRDTFSLQADSSSVIAYCQLNDHQLNVQSSYSLDGQGAVLKVQNDVLTSVSKKFEQNTLHSQGNTRADIYNYGIARSSGYCDFEVKNRINKGCHGCETHQTSRILTFDPQSKGRILPVLYIDDNDVKASHAATMGQPDSEQIFYMQTRGLTRQQAMRLITIGYLMPVTEVIDDEELNTLLKKEIETKVSECLK